MLINLHVRNLALIDEADISFNEGLNILTGETGAGKSIVLGSINIALGSKVSADIIRKDAEYALTELTFHIDDKERLEVLKDYGIEELDEGDILISRKITSSRSQIKVNGQSFTASQVRTIAGILIDIHGQHDNQKLLNEARHIDVIDSYGAKKCAKAKDAVAQAYAEYHKNKMAIQKLDIDDDARQREISFAEYEVNEIEAAQLQEGEDIELETAYRKMSNSQKIIEDVSLVDKVLSADDNNISDMIGTAVRAATTAVKYDESLSGLVDTLSDIESMIFDASHIVNDYIDDCSYDESDFMKIEQRLDLINSLKHKYGTSIDDILKYQESKKQRLDELYDFDAVLSKLKSELENSAVNLNATCEQLSTIRKNCAKELTACIVKSLKELNFLDVRFETEFVKSDSFSANGNDIVRFMIAANPGEDLKPLSKIASGGELSRIMLAIKTVIANQDKIDTLIFDEIDAGISGRTAQMVADKLSQLSHQHQILCITHLPQIASMADTHFMIEKKAAEGKTTTRIFEIDENATVNELARLLGGSTITDNVLNNAREMRQFALESKTT